MNKLREIVSERPMSSARAFHILTVRVKKDLWYVVVWESLPSFNTMPGYTASHSACNKTTNLCPKFYRKTALNGEIPVNKYQNSINHMS